ncbi:15038_t:CDS:2, partial [Rhizophagus irregularis]
AIVIEHPTNPLTSVKTSIKSTSMTINTAAPKHDPKFHCNKSTIGKVLIWRDYRILNFRINI